MTIAGTNIAQTEIDRKVLVVLAAARLRAARRNGVHTPDSPSERDTLSERVFVDSSELPIFCESLIEKGGGVRKVARLLDINSGLITMARNGYYAPAFISALFITRYEERKRWITDTDHNTFVSVESSRKALGITRRQMLKSLGVLLENDEDVRQFFAEQGRNANG